MNQIIFSSPKPVTLVGGGAATVDDLKKAQCFAPGVIAADGGAALCLSAGVEPEAVIGDLDSLSPSLRATLPPERVHHIPEQDSTDFDKALRSVHAPLVLGVGFLGRRVDHQLAALNRLSAYPHRAIILLDQYDVVCHVPPRLALPLAPGERVSLFPLTTVAGRSTGLVWPIDGIAMAPDGRVGTSNQSTGAVTLDMDGPGMLLLLPRHCLKGLVAALQDAVLWPVRTE